MLEFQGSRESSLRLGSRALCADERYRFYPSGVCPAASCRTETLEASTRQRRPVVELTQSPQPSRFRLEWPPPFSDQSLELKLTDAAVQPTIDALEYGLLSAF